MTTPGESMQLQKRIVNRSEEGLRHPDANNQPWNLYEELDFGKEKPAQGLNRALLSLVIIVCLISLTALMLTLLMLFGKISPANKDTYSAPAQRLQTLENLGAELTGLKSVLNRTNTDLAELRSTQTKEKLIYHQTMTPSWLEAHVSHINSNRLSTTEQLTFNAGSENYAALLKVPLIPANVLQNSTMLTVRIVVSNDVSIGTNEDSDTRYGVSDEISFLGFWTVDKINYDIRAPCYGMESSPGVKGPIDSFSPRPNETFYPGQFVFTLKLDGNESWGSCYTAHDGGFVKTAVYKSRLNPSLGLTLEVYKYLKGSRVGIKFIEVTVVDDL